MNTKKLLMLCGKPWISKLRFWEPWSSCRLMGAESAELLDMDAMLNLCANRLAASESETYESQTSSFIETPTEEGIVLQKIIDSMQEHPMQKKNLENLSEILTIFIESMINHRLVFTFALV